MIRMLSNEADIGELNSKWPVMLMNGWTNAGAWEPANVDPNAGWSGERWRKRCRGRRRL